MDKCIAKLQIPEGYRINKEESTLDYIVLEKVQKTPKTWKDFLDSNERFPEGSAMVTSFFTGGKHHVEVHDCFSRDVAGLHINHNWATTVAPSKELAEAFVALSKLIFVRNAIVEDWEDEEGVTSYTFHNLHGVNVTSTVKNSPLSFPTEEMAEKFLSNNEYLLRKAAILL